MTDSVVPHCPLCDSTRAEPLATARDVEYHTSAHDWQYLLCRSCDVVFLGDPPADRLDEIYPENYYSFGPLEKRSLAGSVKEALDRRLFRRILASVEGEPLHVLDIGGGSGWLLSVIRDLDPRVVETHEIDIDGRARDRAEQAGHVFHQMRVEEFDSDQRFDLVLMLNLIEHVADPRAVLTQIRGCLATGGRVLIKTPNHATLDRRIFQHRNWGGFHCPRHFVLFSAPSLRALSADCGFSVARLSYTQGAPQWTASILGWAWTHGWIHLGPERPLHTHPLYGPVAAVTAGFDFARGLLFPTAQMFVELKAK